MESMSRRLLPIVAALAVLAAACSHPEPAPLPAAAAPAVVAPSPTPSAPVTHAQEPKGTLAARSIQQHLDIWKRWAPEARPTWTFDTRNPVGEALAMLVTGERTDDAGIDWVRILLPIRPNEAGPFSNASAPSTPSPTWRSIRQPASTARSRP